MGSLQPILAKAQSADHAFLIETLRSRINFSSDAQLRALHAAYAEAPDAARRDALTSRLEHEIRYAGSADLAYVARRLLGRAPGVDIDEVIRDAARHLRVPLMRVGTTEAHLQRLALGVAARAVVSLPEAQQRELLREHGIGPDLQEEVVRQLKQKGKVAVLPVLLGVLGREAVEQLVPGLIISVLGPLLGREAVKKVVQALIARFPWWGQWLGPVVWTASGAWLALDLQGPAYRKTIPALLYCGLVSLRGGVSAEVDLELVTA